jgi:DNA-binding transcriptional regulator YdaS (Cro superfamily)
MLHMDKLLNYINSLSACEKDDFSAKCKTSIGYLRKAISKGSLLSPALCVLIENASNSEVTRVDLRPNDWQDIWPELAEAA